MNINEILDDNLIIESLEANSKIDALNKMSENLFKYGYISDKKGFLDDVLHREELGTTGIGNYIAIPHGQSDYVEKTTISIAKLVNEVEWETLDDNNVKVIVLFVVKNGKDFSDNHLKLLSEVASTLANNETLEKLLSSKSKNDIKECFI
ncbi:PTS sugar transporter subunit IIA [uncultured Anaerococcus sp.]|uniref:PTS sugar transporter subunit IIA n=1 Tax=uncultured Anaerococcus sp. TaxID=293428 RepID=UPI0025F16FA7|nr:fructose PTS transporter subunit IIA [uncultured Anaerococcus sp.]